MTHRQGPPDVTEGNGSVTLSNIPHPPAQSEEDMPKPDGDSGADRALLLFLLALGGLLSPALLLWTGPGRPWWSLYAVWGLIILLAGLSGRRV